MSSLSNLPGELWDLLKSFFRELLTLTFVPWHFRVYREQVGAPEIPTHLHDRMKVLVDKQEPTRADIEEAVAILDGISEAIEQLLADSGLSGAELAARVADAYFRLYLPLVIYSFRHHPKKKWRYWTWIPTLIAMIDERVGEQFPDPTSAERVGALLGGAWNELLGATSSRPRDQENDGCGSRTNITTASVVSAARSRPIACCRRAAADEKRAATARTRSSFIVSPPCASARSTLTIHPLFRAHELVVCARD